jgi:hypothetical protein
VSPSQSSTDTNSALSEVFRQLQSGEIRAKDASELANLGGKMINSAKVQVEYFALRKEAPRIIWLEQDSE